MPGSSILLAVTAESPPGGADAGYCLRICQQFPQVSRRNVWSLRVFECARTHGAQTQQICWVSVREGGLESLSAADLPIRCVRSHRTVDDVDREDQALVCGGPGGCSFRGGSVGHSRHYRLVGRAAHATLSGRSLRLLPSAPRSTWHQGGCADLVMKWAQRFRRSPSLPIVSHCLPIYAGRWLYPGPGAAAVFPKLPMLARVQIVEKS